MTVYINGTTGITTNPGTLISGSTIGVGGATPSASGAGITFPATQSASTDVNTLDDYEEGTFTPVANRDGSSPTVSYTTQTGTYTKIGNIVNVQIFLRIASVSAAGTGNTTITGLPFSNSVNVNVANGALGANDALVNTVYASRIASTTVYFRSGTRSSSNDSGGWGGGDLALSITYQTS